MSQKKRSDKNSITAALGGFKGAMQEVPIPEGIELRSDKELVIWQQFTRARAREDWRDLDLILLSRLSAWRQTSAAIKRRWIGLGS